MLLSSIKKIKEVKRGEFIKSRDIKNKKDCFRKVLQTHKPFVQKEDQIRIFTSSSSICTSSWHPMAIVQYGIEKYIPSSKIKIGDFVISNGKYEQVINVSNGNFSEDFADFTIEETNNYYAGDTTNLILAHNTVYTPFWHYEIEDILVLKNNKGTEDNRLRHVDWAIQFSRLAYERLIAGSHITLFDPNEVPELYEAFFRNEDEFKQLYEQAERKTSIRKKKIPALDLFSKFIQERKGTGRVYLMNVDHANSHGAFKPEVAPVKMSNLCTEILLHSKPLRSIDDPEAEIALCILGSVNLAAIKSPDDFKEPCELLVRALDELIDFQSYPVKAAERSATKRRTLGIGINNLAYWLAKNDLNYQDISTEGLKKIDVIMEGFSYHLIKASADLAVEKGPCELWKETKYSEGLVALDTYKKDVDILVDCTVNYNWDGLRQQLKTTGIRNSTLSAIMPSETNSLLINATNGIEPPRALVSVKQSKDGVVAQVVPEIYRLKNKYDLLWDQKSPEGYLKIVAVMEKWIDQAISVNTSYNPIFYPNNEIPMSEMLNHLLFCYKYGIPTLYYCNTFDGAGEVEVPQVECESCKL